LIAERGEGSFRDSISLLDQLSNFASTISRTEVESVLGLAPSAQIAAILHDLEQGNVAALAAKLNQIQQDGISLITLSEQLIKALSEQATDQPDYYQLINQLFEAHLEKSPMPLLQLTAILGAAAAKNANSAKSDPAKTDDSPNHSASSESATKPKTVAQVATPSADLAEIIEAKIAREKPLVTPEQTTKPAKNAAPDISAKTDESSATESSSVSDKSVNSAPTDAAQPADSATKSLPDQLDWNTILDQAKQISTGFASVLKAANFDWLDQQLTLYFARKFQRDKCASPKYRAMLDQTFQDLFGAVPPIHIADGPKLAAESHDANVAKIADIMGGGELVKGAV
jgi:DNA polymerase III gamma/tau subunit